ncbi:MAG: hypothetical protein JXO72_09650 [Vicinamibacteria bacterium]|nr:hypothetical protein [Vicinamibacteria bacterium]
MMTSFRTGPKPSFESVSVDIEQRLHQKELDTKIEAWIRTLCEGAWIRYNESVVEEADQ